MTPKDGRYLLDTNIVIAYRANESAVVQNVDQADEIFVPSIVVGELFFGARKSGRVAHNLAWTESFIARVRVLDCDVDTARHYGQIKQELRRKGRPIPENDIWIAAIARQYDLPLVTRDTQHFSEVDNLTIETW